MSYLINGREYEWADVTVTGSNTYALFGELV